MTTSSARRRNRNARRIARRVPASDAAKRYATEGAFTPHDARRWVHNASPYLWPTPPEETNWELVAEQLNRKVRSVVLRGLVLSIRHLFTVEVRNMTPTRRPAVDTGFDGGLDSWSRA